MLVYGLTIFTAIIFAWIIKTNKNKGINGLVNFVLVAILILGLALVVGFRYDVGTDFFGYKRMFEVYKDYSWGEIFGIKEPGIRLIVKLSSLMSSDYSLYLFICAIITTGIPIIVMYRHSENFLFSVTIYLFVSYLAQCNGMRQTLAMAIVFAGYRYIKNKCIWKFLIFVLIGMIFHNSAIFAIPIFFIYATKPNWVTTLIIFFVTLFMRFSYDVLVNAVGFFRDGDFETTSYVNTSVNILRIVVMIIPLILLTPYKEKMFKENALAVNMLIANAAVYLCMAGSAYFARLGMFTDMFLCMAIPSIINRYGEKDRGIITLVAVLYFGIYFYANVTLTSDLTPYQSVLW